MKKKKNANSHTLLLLKKHIIFLKIMELPPELVSIIYEYARPYYTHPRWREGSYSAQALKDSDLFYDWNDLVHYGVNWSWVKWWRFNQKVLRRTAEWRSYE